MQQGPSEPQLKRLNFSSIRQKIKLQGLVPRISLEPILALCKAHSDLPELCISTLTPDIQQPAPASKKSFEQDFELKQKIGEGCNGVVRRCIQRSTGLAYVVKISHIDEEHILFLRRSFGIIRKLNHPSIVRYRAMYFKLSQFKCYLVMEYLPYPSLRKFKHLDGDKIKTIVKNLLESIQYMHSRKLCHRDLKLDNILYDEKTERIWVIDFGISKVFEERGNKKEMLTNTGTIYYKAPEIFEGGGYDESVDMWAVGVIIYQLFTGKPPFYADSLTDTINLIIDNHYEFGQEWVKYNKLAKDLVYRLLKPKNSRLTAQVALKSPWMLSHRKISGNNMDQQSMKIQSPSFNQDSLLSPLVRNATSDFRTLALKFQRHASELEHIQGATVEQLKKNDDDDIFSC